MRHLLALLLITTSALAQEAPSHALTILGTPALPADFPYFPYVNPDAPKGGEAVFADTGSFDGFNPYILKGNPAMGLGSQWSRGVGGTSAGTAGGHIWESMLTGSADEVASGYGHLAQSVSLSPDGLTLTFQIRPEARFADNTPVLAEDVIWTFNTLMEKGRPSYRVSFAEVAGVEAVGERGVVWHLKTNLNRDLPLAIGGLPVLPKHWWETRDFTRPLTEPPLGSGPYRVDKFELGRSVGYVRRDDWWARDRPTGRGQFNFDRVRIEYYRDPTVAFQAFKAGQSDYRQENISKQWVTAYDFPAVKDGFVQKAELPHKLPVGFQTFFFNTRRSMFKDARVREAIAGLFDFEYLNKNIFYGRYTRMDSYFTNTAQQSHELPDPAELALLEPFRDKLPPALFTEPFRQPATDGSGNNREGLRRALDLFKQAGWTIKDRKLVNEQGEQLAFTLLEYDPTMERLTLPMKQWMQRVGIEVTLRTVDEAQYERLTDEYDFDMTSVPVPGSELPGMELKQLFTCEGAETKGGANLAGVCDPVVDALVQRMVEARDRGTLATAGRALDRVLLRGHYGILTYYKSTFDLATWNRFGRPTTPVRTGFVIDDWWIDPALAAKTDAARRSSPSQ